VIKKDDPDLTDGGWQLGWQRIFLIATYHCLVDGFLVDICLPENFQYVNGNHRSPNTRLEEFKKLVKQHGLDCVLDWLPSGAQGGGDLHIINGVKLEEKKGGRAFIVTFDLFNDEIKQGHVTPQWVKEHTIKPKWDPRSSDYVPDSYVD
jgi:hypothetical protein